MTHAGERSKRRIQVGPEPHFTTGYVATALGMDQKTVREACVDFATWDATAHTERVGMIPCLRIGSWARIPRWWLIRAIDALHEPPRVEPASEDDDS